MLFVTLDCSTTANLGPWFIITTSRYAGNSDLIRYTIRPSGSSATTVNSATIEFMFTSRLRNFCFQDTARNSNQRDVGGYFSKVNFKIRFTTSPTCRVGSITMVLDFFMGFCLCVIAITTRIVTYRVCRRCVFHVFFKVDRWINNRFDVCFLISITTNNSNSEISNNAPIFCFAVNFKEKARGARTSRVRMGWMKKQISTTWDAMGFRVVSFMALSGAT